MELSHIAFALLCAASAAAISAVLLRLIIADDDEQRDFVRVIYDGGWIILSPAEACAMIQEADDPKAYKVEPVRMTMKEFEALPEFEGF